MGANIIELQFYQQAASTIAECHMRCFLEISKQTQTNCTVSSFQILAKGTTVSHDSPRTESYCRFSLNNLLRLTWAQCTDTDNIFVEQFLSQSLSLMCQELPEGCRNQPKNNLSSQINHCFNVALLTILWQAAFQTRRINVTSKNTELLNGCSDSGPNYLCVA